jgi:hypothetical protein
MSRHKAISVGTQSSSKFTLSASKICLSMGIVTLGFAPHLRAQEPGHQTSSVVEAARNARQSSTNSGKQPKIITNADLNAQPSVSNPSTYDLEPSSTNAAQDPNLSPVGCDNPQAKRLNAELQAAQQELDQLRHDLQYSPPVVSGRNLDLQNFKPGNSGFNVGAPPLLDAQPPVPARVTEVELQERVESLQKSLRVACEPPEAARIQTTVDQLEQELNILQRQFALDQEDYCSKPVTERLGGNAQLDAEQQQIQDLQTEIRNLREELAALMPPQGSR